MDYEHYLYNLLTPLPQKTCVNKVFPEKFAFSIILTGTKKICHDAAPVGCVSWHTLFINVNQVVS